ncbi:TetR/AcrR family transcriptional regulator [Falsiroseomonas tokyonensis]|uniref:TetR/AcrR family transcriptional regulator n=1 Tax=Falsiroseomonas tokyonensis TaxID=430521 RepID=A0ABV7BS01_9PROT|nr:TetR/AcrR family transcriptional regulator [Falsiroseomonas tokyonensis]
MPTRRRRKEARPGEIVEAGLAEFGARGFAAARMEDVARRAQVAKGTVFLYFPTKEALFEAVAARATPLQDDLLAQIESEQGSSLDLLRALLSRLYAAMARPETVALMRIMIMEGQRFPAILESWHRVSVQRAQVMLERIVERGIAAGEIRPGALTALPMVLAGPAVMAALWRITFDPLQPLPIEQFRDAHLDLVTRAFGP